MSFRLRRHRVDDGPPADLSAFVDGELRRRQRRAVARHLRDCPACRLVVAQLREVRALTAELAGRRPSVALAGPRADGRAAAWWRPGRRRE